MPNWCLNKIEVFGSKESLDKFAELAKKPSDLMREYYEEGDIINLSLSSTVPPEKIDMKHLNEIWGVNRDIFDAEVERPTDEQLEYRFSSAWKPPMEWLKTTAEKFPELFFSLTYIEPGEVFCGFAEAEGEDFSEDYHENELLPEILQEFGLETDEEEEN